MQSWHDYHLTGYAVDGARHTMTLNLVWPYEIGPDIRRAQLLFTGVAGHRFEHDLGVGILFGITEAPLAAFLSEHAGLFEQEQKWGWPLFWRGTVANTLAECEARSLKVFEIDASYGLNGWVLAEAMEWAEHK